MSLSAKHLIPAAPLVVLTALYVPSELVSIDGRGTSAVATGVSAVFLIAPAAGAWGAWRAGALRRGGVLELGPSRTGLEIAAGRLVPVIGGTLGVLVFAVLIALLGAGRIVTAPDLRVVGMGAAVVIGDAVLGYAVGIRAPAVVAVPGTFVLLYLWMVFPQAFEPLWVRHLNGFSIECCGLRSDFDPGALVAPSLIAGALVVAGVLAAADGRWLARRVIGASIVVVVAVTGATRLVSHLGASPVTPRPAAELVCAGEGPRVCVWPENAFRLDEMVQAARSVRSSLERWGVEVPATATEAAPMGARTPGWHIGMRPVVEPERIRPMLVATLIPEGSLYCFAQRHEDEVFRLEAWLAIKSGFDRSDIEGALPPEDLAAVDAILERSKEEQLRWYELRYATLERCVAAGRNRDR